MQDIYTELESLIVKWDNSPFLFIGSGISRRYYALPDWKGLLIHFAQELRPGDQFAWAYYEHKIPNPQQTATSNFPLVTDIIEKEFNTKWFNEPSLRHVDDEETLRKITGNTLSPFKAEVAAYIKAKSQYQEQYHTEIKLLKKLFEKSINGIITTNYDFLLETLTDGYKPYIGQEGILSSLVMNIGEIYKIHGCVSLPETLVLNSKDYAEFFNKSAYLSAKLMTIFLENPVVFLGYSMNDPNIQQIFRDIVKCLSLEQLSNLKKKMIFVEYVSSPQEEGVSISSMVYESGNKTLDMIRVKLFDFTPLYRAIRKIQRKMPIKVLRFFKENFYEFIKTNTPNEKVCIAADIELESVKPDTLVIGIGKPEAFAKQGMVGIDQDQWYRDIVMDDLDISSDDFLTIIYPNLNKRVGPLPICKHLYRVNKQGYSIPNMKELKIHQKLDELIPTSYKNKTNREKFKDASINSIWGSSEPLRTKARYIASLPEENMDVNELGKVLKELYLNDLDFLHKLSPNERSGIRRLIRIYDFLKYGSGASTTTQGIS